MDQTALRPKPMPGRQPGQKPGRNLVPDPGRNLVPDPGQNPGRNLVPDPGQNPGRNLVPDPGQNPVPDPGRRSVKWRPGTGKQPEKGRRPHAARRRGRRLTTLLFGLLCAVVLVLCGVGLGTVSATVIGMSKLAETQKAARGAGASAQDSGAAVRDLAAPAPRPGAPVPQPGASPQKPGAPAPTAKPPTSAEPGPHPPAPRTRTATTAPTATTATLGIEAVDAPGGEGALLVGVHVPGPGHTAGLVRGDTLLAFGGTRIGSAARLASVIGAARPGRAVALTVRHEGGGRQLLPVRPGVVT
ncbi:PDZ domain-containing protein [Streptomyces sp. NPDC058284]|uniref:PDZ domain-containing protein n=1 Tax=unclassified Streptomyces TaxID=2593676 RepID=UPI0036475B80